MYLDGLCIDVNPSNSLKNIQIPILRDIYLANRTSWSQVPGSNQTSTIHPFGRDSNGGTYTFFSQAVLNGKPPSSKVTPLGSDTLIMNQVKADPANIGYAGLAYQGAGIKKLKVGGVACKPSTIKPLRYPLSRFIWLVLPTSHPNVQVEKFADWARTSHKAGEVISAAGGVPAFNKGFR
jgi:phosphate transport system substrate-binding protein